MNKEKTGAGRGGYSVRRLWAARAEELLRAAAGDPAKLAGAVAGAVFAFFLARAETLFSTYPLGLAFICSSGLCAPLYGAAAAVGALTAGSFGAVYAVSAAGALLVRLLTWALLTRREGGRLFREGAALKTAAAAVSGFAVGALRLLCGGYSDYNAYAAFFLVFSCPAAAFLFSCRSGEFRESIWRRLGEASVITAAVFLLVPLEILGVGIAAAAAFCAAAIASEKYGMYAGCVVGLMCGLVISPLYAPMFGAVGFLCGLLSRYSYVLSLGGGALAALAYASVIGGFSAFTGYLPDILVGFAVSYPLLRYRLYEKKLELPGTARARETGDKKLGKRQYREICERIETLSETFRDLSECAAEMSDRQKKPGIADAKEICDSVCDRFCPKCKNNSLCWEKEYISTSDAIERLSRDITQGLPARRESLPEYFSERCKNIDRMIETVNGAGADLTRRLLAGDKCAIFAMDFSAVSDILSDAVKKSREEYAYDEPLSKRLARMLMGMKLSARFVSVYGSRRRYVIVGGVDLRNTGEGGETIRRAFEKACGCPFSEPHFEIDGEFIMMTLITAPRFEAETGKAESSKYSGSECGDSSAVFRNGEERMYTMISDGMGSGREAALASGICELFLEKMLSAGNRKETAISLLNSFIRERSTECHVTLDLFELDLITGSGAFIKSGAAPSFVRRGGELFRIQSKTMPIGIMRAVDAEQISYHSRDGDSVIMVSDGVTQSYDICPWLTGMLKNEWEENPGRMAAKIVRRAEIESKCGDDISVVIVKIKERRCGE